MSTANIMIVEDNTSVAKDCHDCLLAGVSGNIELAKMKTKEEDVSILPDQ